MSNFLLTGNRPTAAQNKDWSRLYSRHSKAVVLNRRPPGHIRPAVGLFVAPFTAWFGWVSTCKLGLVSMPTIHRQPVTGHSLLRAQFLTFTFVFGAEADTRSRRSTVRLLFIAHCDHGLSVVAAGSRLHHTPTPSSAASEIRTRERTKTGRQVPISCRSLLSICLSAPDLH